MKYKEIEIRKKIAEAKRRKAEAKEMQADEEIIIGEYDLQLLQFQTDKPSEKEVKMYRNYGKTAHNNTMKIKTLIMLEDVEKNPDKYSDDDVGHFLFSKGKISRYSITDLYLLKQEIPNTKEYRNFTELGQLIGVNSTTTSALCLMIEKGKMEEYFKIWENQFGKPMFNRYGQLIY